jgi:hypothetical protein
VGVGKEDAPFREPVYVRRLYLWMSAQAPYPIVQIIYGNEEHIWRRSSGHFRSPALQTAEHEQRDSESEGIVLPGHELLHWSSVHR